MSCVDEGGEVFFDTTDHLMLEESAVIEKEEFVDNELGYDIWLREPQSVKERREVFFRRMGFTECWNSCESETIGSERITEPSGAVSSFSGSSWAIFDDKLSCEWRESNSEANCLVDSSEQGWLEDLRIDVEQKNLESGKRCAGEKVQACVEEKKVLRWWRQLTQKIKKRQGHKLLNEPKSFSEDRNMTRVKIEQNRKRFKECTAVYGGQMVNAHSGLIWSLKFSPDGQYLASGGNDGVVCIWRVSLVGISCETKKCSFGARDVETKPGSRTKKLSHPGYIVPEKTFHIEEEPVRKFYGHRGDVLDLAWSTSNHLLSSSVDKTVRLWHVGSDRCLGVFQHSNYVTCVQFNPVDENYFISGAIDGKVRIWGLSKRRVEEWVDVRDIVTAICYQPNGKGFIAGSVSGTCCFYETIGDEFLLKAEIDIAGRTKSSGHKITGIQFLKSESPRVMITSEDSKIRILEGLEVVRKYKGLPKSGAQTSASFTSNGRHFISVGEDSHIYMWNYDDLFIKASKKTNSTRSCEHFLSKDVCVAIPWSNLDAGRNSETNSNMSINYHSEATSRAAGSDCFTLSNRFLTGRSSKGRSVTWPEEKLPLDLPYAENSYQWRDDYLLNQPPQKSMESRGSRSLSSTWGLVFVTGNVDGTIRTFHNYGLPSKT